MKSYSDLEKLGLYAQQIHDSGIDITPDQKNEWTMIAYACASQGEAGREPYHLICSNYPGYSREETDDHFSYCLKTSKHCVSIGTLVKIAHDHGIELKLPRGRRPKTEEQKKEAQKNLFENVKEAINKHCEFRYNTLSERVEMKPHDGDWRDFDDRELNGILTKLHSSNVKVSKDNLSTYINSGVFSTPYNPVEEYVKGLKRWNRRTDYIRQVFGYLRLEEGSDVEFLFECFKLYFVAMVACGMGLDVTNQLMLVLEGEKEGTGKTEFILRLLPPALRHYLHSPVQLSAFKDKDEALAMAHSIIFFLDEIQLNRQTFNKLKNMAGGAGANTVTERAPFAHNVKVRNVHASLAATTNHVDFLPEDLGNRRFLVLQVVGSENYDSMPIDKAFAQAYYLATHPRRFSTHITPEMIARLKEINWKYVAEDICTAILPTVLRHPNPGEQAQGVISGEIISWLTSRTGPNRDYTPQKVNAAMKKMGFIPKDSNKGNVYFVKRIMAEDLKREGELLANQELKKETEPELPF